MGKWEKRVAILAAGSLVTGVLFLGAGALAGGVQDARNIYQEEQDRQYKYQLKMSEVSTIDVDLSSAIFEIQTGNVDKVEVSYYQKMGKERFVFEEDSKTQTLKVTDARNSASKTQSTTDMIRFFSYLASERDYNRDKVIITIPKGTQLKDLTVKIVDGHLFMRQLKADNLNIDSYDVLTSLVNLQVNKAQLAIHDSSLDMEKTQIESGEMLASDSEIDSKDNSIKNFNISGTDSYIGMDGKVENLEITNQGGSIDFSKGTFRGKITVDSVDAPVTFADFKDKEQYQLDLKARDGGILHNDTYIDDAWEDSEEESSESLSHNPTNPLAEIRVRTQSSNISLNDDSDILE
ncbi:DUF4097 family beta strand repeat-containing protein [Streptococcus merionis]|uniref:Adhesin AIDA-I n=1 Tax=Streptococcus merionis TaxID=400065 RepID=A0A239SNI5_9STRE|nr:DUF4097 family beta strand repeat-containing protein [Streptococcus merionis]SNU87015.1 Adhesin AIDA-I [Streptococcus merionis]